MRTPESVGKGKGDNQSIDQENNNKKKSSITGFSYYFHQLLDSFCKEVFSSLKIPGVWLRYFDAMLKDFEYVIW